MKNKLDSLLKRVESSVKEVVSKKAKKQIGNFAISLIVKRTRLGYGVEKNFGERKKLAALKGTGFTYSEAETEGGDEESRIVKRRVKDSSYVLFRKNFGGLSPFTKPRKSNLTLTGLMLTSMKAKFVGESIIIGPTGERNIEAAKGNSKPVTYGNGYTKPARVFNRVSQLEFNQIKRFYRKTFGDLLKNRKLIK